MKALLFPAVLLLLFTSALASTQQFVVASVGKTSAMTSDVVSADFNGDGNPDLAFADSDYNGDVLTVLLGKPDGSFTVKQDFTGPFFSGAIISGDWNGDGVPDLAVASQGVVIYLGVGDGTFVQGNQYGSDFPVNVAAGDLNGDGVLDLVTTVNPPASVQVWLGQGDGDFTAGATYTLSANQSAIGVITADFNRDHKLDVAVAIQNSGSVAVLLGNGDGTLQTPAFNSGTVFATNLATSDFNHDGIPDIAVTGHQLGVLLGNGDGTFKPARHYRELFQSGGLTVADINGDGNVDVLAVNQTYQPAALALFLGNADGTFQTSILLGITTSSPIGVAVADFNKDGHPDVVVGDRQKTFFNIFFGAPGGKLVGRRDFSVLRPRKLDQETQVTGIAVGYLNSDDNLDVAVSDEENGQVIVLLGQKNGTFCTARDYGTGGGPQTIAVADFNHDGKTDIVTSSIGGISILLGNGTGNYPTHTDYFSAGAEFVVTADVNGDGHPDVLGVSESGKSVIAFLNDGTGHFRGAPVVTAMHYNPFWLATGDFNGDGKLDVVTANRGTAHAATVLLGNGDGTFTVGTTFATPKSFWRVGSVAVGDFTSDGKLDFILSSSGNLYVYPGNGDGTFADPVKTVGEFLGAIGDFNRDGKLDSMNGHLLLGRGDGTFQIEHVTNFDSAAGLATGDFNHDGALDMVIGGERSNTIDVLLNTGAK